MSLDFLKSPVFMRVCAGCANGNEATAFADPQNEALIQKAFGELTRGKTVLMIAHRLTTVRTADSILVLEKDGLYAEMWKDYQQAARWKVGKEESK